MYFQQKPSFFKQITFKIRSLVYMNGQRYAISQEEVWNYMAFAKVSFRHT